MEYKFYEVSNGVMGHIGNGVYIKFPSDSEYSEYIKDTLGIDATPKNLKYHTIEEYNFPEFNKE